MQVCAMMQVVNCRQDNDSNVQKNSDPIEVR